MKKSNAIFILLLALIVSSVQLQAQTTYLSGTVTSSESKEKLPAVSIMVKGKNTGTFSNSNGGFTIKVGSFPTTLIFSSTGFETIEKTIDRASDTLTIELNVKVSLSDPVVVTPTMVNIGILEAPVSIERFGHKSLQMSPAMTPYETLGYAKGVDATISSLTFKSMSTRGFNGSGSPRVNQLVDGMDNQAPGLNFSVGNVIGLTDLDVESIELLPGASSALYGPGGMNGTIFINSMNPFKYKGLSMQIKQGAMHIDKRQRDKASLYSDYSFRWATQIGDRFAFKIGGQFIQAKDWVATDYSNYQRQGSTGKVISGNRQSDPNYDGVNVYGDETHADLRLFLASVLPPGHPLLAKPIMVSRTGYLEKEVVDPDTRNIKLSGALHYKITEKLEARFMANWGTGNTVYTGSARYNLKDLRMGQYKLELKHENWFLRGYTTQENAGESYSATVTTRYFNEAWKPSYNPANPMGSWYPQYMGAFLTALNQRASMSMAHNAARSFADQGRPIAGSQQFNHLYDSVRMVPIPKGGLFVDRTSLYVAEGQYNLTPLVKFAEVIIGGDWKKYRLNSRGTIFIDTAGAIPITEMGAYAQATRKFFNGKLVLSASGRYDKNENFKGKFTPRVTALIRLAENNNLRLSYQTAYRFPTTQQQFIKLDIGDAILLGGLPWVNDCLKPGEVATYVIDPNTGQLSPYQYKELKPESMRSFEIGYKGLIKKNLMVDLYSYFGSYNDFLGRIYLLQPTVSTTKPFSIVTNSSTKVNTYGFGAGLDYVIARNFSIFANAFSDKLTHVPNGFVANFNAPDFRFNVGFANPGMGKQKRIGFNVLYRWQKSVFWESDFAQGTVPSFGTIDAQVSYKLPAIKSIIKIGGTNLANKYYQNAFGNPQVGGIYYASFAFNVF